MASPSNPSTTSVSGAAAASIAGTDIARVLQSQGPVVKCVFLRARSKRDGNSDNDDNDSKPSANGPARESPQQPKERTVLSHLIQEIDVDTTPRKSMVREVLGGPFTFLGQYEDEGIVLMVRDTTGVDPLELPPYNPHTLQPPLDRVDVRGDILVMKVAETEEVLDEDNNHDGESPLKEHVVPTNDDFFLPYSKEEYIAFASRTDVVAPSQTEEESSGEEEGESDEEEDSNDQDYEVGEDDEEEDDEEAHVAMMNLVMRQVLRRFHEDNGRGPNTQELLELRAALAEKMGMEDMIADVDPSDADWDRKVVKKRRRKLEPDPSSPYKASILTRKRTLEEDEEDDDDKTAGKSSTNDSCEPSTKRVKFDGRFSATADDGDNASHTREENNGEGREQNGETSDGTKDSPKAEPSEERKEPGETTQHRCNNTSVAVVGEENDKQ